MAARITRQHDEMTRRKIQTSQLINRLNNHAVGKCDMTNTQVRAAEVLLKKVLPDLQALQHSGDPDKPLVHKVEQVIVDTKNTRTP